MIRSCMLSTIYDGIKTKQISKLNLCCIFPSAYFAKTMHKFLINFSHIVHKRSRTRRFLHIYHMACARARKAIIHTGKINRKYDSVCNISESKRKTFICEDIKILFEV